MHLRPVYIMHLCLYRSAHPFVASLWKTLFLASVLTAAIAEKLENGLEIETTKHGECSEKAQKGDVISMHYTGSLPGGTVFDSSYDRDEPLEFKLGEGLVIDGWDLGLIGTCLGEERRLVIPPKLGYGARKMGPIPPDSTLTFETKLVGINGVTEDHVGTIEDKPSTVAPGDEATDKPESSHHHAQEGDEKDSSDSPDGEDDTTPEPPKQPGAENGECRLLGPFALVVQAGLGLLALFSLVWKRWRERPRRPVKVWFFDVSKQVVGSVLLHLLNVLMSMISSEDYEMSNKAKQIQDDSGREPNPCSYYLINIAVDTTLGIPILVLFLKVLHRLAALTPLARPAESIKSGNYGHPPHASWWLKQSIVYFIGLLLMKFCVLAIFGILPWIALVGDWALRWTEDNEALQIVFVMFIFPLIMNALQYYIIDSFIKDPAAGESDTRSSGDADENDESREPLHRASEYEEGFSPPLESEDVANTKQSTAVTTKDARDSMTADYDLDKADSEHDHLMEEDRRKEGYR